MELQSSVTSYPEDSQIGFLHSARKQTILFNLNGVIMWPYNESSIDLPC